MPVSDRVHYADMNRTEAITLNFISYGDDNVRKNIRHNISKSKPRRSTIEGSQREKLLATLL